jgi:hypothetical protein
MILGVLLIALLALGWLILSVAYVRFPRVWWASTWSRILLVPVWHGIVGRLAWLSA